MSRWESLKSERGGERGQINNGSGLGRNNNNRWAYFNSNAKNDRSRQQTHESSIRGRLQRQARRQQRENQDKEETDSLLKIEPVKNDKFPILIAEHHTVLNSLKSKLVRYQSEETKDEDEKSVVIDNLMGLLGGTTKSGYSSTADKIHSNTDVFVALLDLLKIAGERKVFDGSDDLRSLIALTIESCWKISETGGKTNSLTNLCLSRPQVELGVATLSFHYHELSARPPETQSQVAFSLLFAIALLTKNYIYDLPPESTARHVVGAIFIPYLSSSRLNRDQIKGQNEVHPIKFVCEATIALLNNPSHASAILAPLVQFEYGIEEQITNPLRVELLGVLLKCLERQTDQDYNDENMQTEEIEYICQTLSATVDSIRKVKKGNETDNTVRSDANVQIIKPIQKFILGVLIEYKNRIRTASEKPIAFENLMVSSLQLLRTLVACHPKAMTGTGWKLIIEGANRNVTSRLSHSSDSSGPSTPITSPYLPMLILVDKGFDETMHRPKMGPENLSLTMDCIADFISALPWKKWLKQNETRASVMMQTKVETSGLYKNVVDALASLIGIVRTFFCKCNEKLQMKSLGRLIKAIMLEIPYCDKKLIHAGEDLWKAIAATISDWQKHDSISFVDEKQNLACEVLFASSGGTTTPQGNMRGMSLPAQIWFLGKSSSTTLFLKRLLDSFESMDDQFEQSIRILSSVLRTLPDVAVQRWDAFLKIFKETNPGSNRKDLMRMEVLESFMLGRKDFEVSTDLKSKNDKIITDLDRLMLKRWNQNSLQRCMNIYSAFGIQDWAQLDQIDGRVSCHLDIILSCCQHSSAKIREGAARAVGEFCTHYVIYDTSSEKSIEYTKMQHYQLIVHKVHSAMLELYRDKNAGARSMSIFSLGNLASTLIELKPMTILETPRLHEIHKAMLRSFGDTNDKVVKNAIRSVGHTSNLLALSLRHGGCDDYVSASLGLLVETVESLTSKLWNTLHVALNEEQKASMTWKERSAAKKHGWGACHSLGLVFEGLWLEIFEDSNELASACLKAAQCLVHCPCHHFVLNEKVVLAAMAAVCHLPSQFFIKKESQEIILGDALTISILILESNVCVDVLPLKGSGNCRRVTAKVAAQNGPFLLHILNSASIVDTTMVLADDLITTQTLGILYSWMVEGPQFGGLTARAFKVFALALQQPGRWTASIEFEQKFWSRALQKHKQEMISVLAQNSSGSIPEQIMNDDDESDEL